MHIDAHVWCSVSLIPWEVGPLVSRCTGCQFDIIIIVIALPTQMSTGSTPYYTHANVYACERVHWPLLMAKWYSSPHQSDNSLIKSGMPDQETSFSLAGCQPMCAHARMCAHTLHTHTHTLSCHPWLGRHMCWSIMTCLFFRRVASVHLCVFMCGHFKVT